MFETMPPKVTRVRGRRVNKRNGSNKPVKSESNEPLPQGKSYIDLLPDDVLQQIYKMKHQLEFNPTLDILDKLRLAIDCELIEMRLPIRKLLEKINTKKQLYIDVGHFTPPKDDNGREIIQNKFNTKKIAYYQGWGTLRELELKFNDKVDLMVIDILHIIEQMGMSSIFITRPHALALKWIDNE